MITRERIDRYVELLTLCQTLQTEKDGIERPAFGVVDKTKTLDQFTSDLHEAMLAVRFLGKYSGMVDRLGKLGERLAERGEIEVGLGDYYSDAALDHVMRHFGVEGPGSRGGRKRKAGKADGTRAAGTA